MKKAILPFIFALSYSAFAGDMNLVCEDEKNDDFLSVSINEGNARLLLSIEGDPLLLNLKQVKSERQTRYDLTVTDLKSHRKEEIGLKIFEEVQLGSYVCLVRD
jgi:hypothetical protein